MVVSTVAAFSDYNSVSLEFSTDEDARSTLSYTYTDKNGISQSGSSAQTGYQSSHIYVLKNISRDTTVNYTFTAYSVNGGAGVVAASSLKTKNPELFANIRTASLTLSASYQRLSILQPSLFTVPRVTYMQITVSGNTDIRFEENQPPTILLSGQVYYFNLVGDAELKGAGVVANVSLMPNPNF